MRVLIKPDLMTPAHTIVISKFMDMRNLIDGYIECHMIEKDICILMDEEGDLKGKKPTLKDPMWPDSWIVGTVMFARVDDYDRFTSLTDEDIETIKRRYGWN